MSAYPRIKRQHDQRQMISPATDEKAWKLAISVIQELFITELFAVVLCPPKNISLHTMSSSTSQEDTPRRKVLLAVDHSEHSLRALNWYLDDLHKEDSILYILHCQELPPLMLPPDAHVTAIYEDWLEEAKKTEAKNKELLHFFKQKCESRNVKCEVFLEHASSAGDALCHFIKEHKPNYVVIGSRGQGMVRRTVLGSVSDFVIHHSAVPVCVCPPVQ